MATLSLGYRTTTGVKDGANGTQVNPYLPGTGWDVLVTPDIFNTKETEFEVYQIALDGPVGSSLLVAVDGHPFNYVNQGWSNSYDPSQPLLLNAGNTLQFCWNFAFASGPYNKTSNILPTVTVYLRRVQGVLS